MSDFSAQHYVDMPDDKFKAEAEKLGVDLYGKNHDQQINAVYNAELRRRQIEAQSEPVPESDELPEETDYETMTVKELRAVADYLGIELEDRALKADIIAALQESDAG